MQTSVEIEIGNGIYPCAIGLQGIREIERACGAGVGEVIARIMKGRAPDYETAGEDGPKRTIGFTMEAGYYSHDCMEFVRQGLIGAAALGLKPVIDGVPTHPTTQSRANEILANYLTPPVGNLDTLWNLAAFIALNLAEGYVPPEKKSPSPIAAKPKKPRQPRKTVTSSQ